MKVRDLVELLSRSEVDPEAEVMVSTSSSRGDLILPACKVEAGRFVAPVEVQDQSWVKLVGSDAWGLNFGLHFLRNHR
jgi:hypothetical protein